MKKILIGFLFLLGAAEMVWPILASFHRYAFEPKFLRAFDFSKFTEEQRQVYQQFRVAAGADWDIVLYFGVATILIGVLLVVTGRERKHDA